MSQEKPLNATLLRFEHGHDFMYRRALKRRAEGQLISALDLFRQALKLQPDNLEYRMDLAETYYEMGCFERSNEELVRVLAREDAPAECHFGMGCNFYAMADLPSARLAMERYLARERSGAFRKDVSELMGEMRDRVRLYRPFRRHKAARLVQRGWRLFQNGETEAAARALRESLNLYPAQGDARDILALIAARQGRFARARALLNRSGFSTMRGMCCAAQAYWRLGEKEKCSLMLERAQMNMLFEPEDVRLLLRTLAMAGWHSTLYQHLRPLLQELPYDRELLHLNAIAALNLEHHPQEAEKCYQRIRRVYPRDGVAEYFLRALSAGRMRPPLGYEYQVPEEERHARADSVRALAALADGALREKFQDQKVQTLLEWALSSGQDGLEKCALELLGRVGGEEAQAMLRAFLLRPGNRDEARALCVRLLKEMGAREPYYQYALTGVEGLVLSAQQEQMLSMPHRMMLARAARTARGRFGDLTGPLTALWMRCLASGGVPRGALRNPGGWMAALLYWHLRRSGYPASLKEAARLYGAPLRQARRCARVMGRDGRLYDDKGAE